MFRAKRLELTNWCQHKTLTIDWSETTTGIVGPNGRGKTNLIGALYTALTGRVISGNLEDNINFNSNTAEISLDFITDSGSGTVTRTFKVGDPSQSSKTLVKSGAKLRLNSDKAITGVTAVNARLVELIGLTPGVLETHIFVAQDKLTSLLFNPPAERMKAFLTLIPEVSRLSAVRLELQNVLNATPAISAVTPEEQAQLQMEIASLVKDIAELEARQAARSAEVAATNSEELKRKLFLYEKAQQASSAMAQVLASIQELTVKIDADTIQQASQDSAYHTLEAESAKATELANKAKIIKVTLDKQKNLWAIHQQVQAELTAELTRSNALVAPVKPEGEAEINIARATSSHLVEEIGALRKTIAVLEKGDTCPTCGTKFINPADQLAKERDRMTALLTQLAEVSNAVKTYDSALQTYMLNLQEYEIACADVRKNLERLARTPPEILNMPALDTSALAYMEQQIKESDTTARMAERLVQQVKDAATAAAETSKRLHSMEEQKLALSARCDELQAEIDAAPDANTVTQIKQTLEHIARVQTELSDIKAAIAAKTATSCVKQEMFDNNTARIAESKRVERYRNIIDQVRETLHRDNLPKAIMQQYITQLETLCNQFLQVFGTPFVVTIDEDMNMSCTMPNGYVTVAERLSGGQSCVLAVAVRFAINELFGQNMGMLILDEPTQWMDADNIEYMKTLMETVKSVSINTGIQTLIITHHKELMPALDKVVDLT
jgi:DNA repair exonuclease SbcCD ATPase subunit